MAPIQLDQLVGNEPHSANTQLPQRRDLNSKSLITAIILLTIISTIFLLGTLLVLAKVWKKLAARKAGSSSSEVPKDVISAVERKPSDWARKDSNILWSMYIEEDDLKSQFSFPAKSRLFSIGSASSEHGRCPLDRRGSDVEERSQSHATDREHSPDTSVDMDIDNLRSRAAYEQEATPTKNITRARSRSQPFHHRHSDSLEHIARRKQSVPGPPQLGIVEA